ncbi:conserved protein of unknown function [Rhodovastum atsumiense]|uniref:Uncharacterized protein n=1 Tax=Rhodovastum atsumiense TaxID=504468 RepID=A0A5M6J2T4_9PROT|nr:hypothetical protein [Rhodovastum atsumiense]KAA5613908.1 hypothetical protein F1189_03795 [Rhodovastum atsumiense]CAH2602036.1 conserved protein of unknown function [Rhodovastum atsumiense]
MTTLPGDQNVPVAIDINILARRTREHHPRSGDVINAASATIDISVSSGVTVLAHSLPVLACQDIVVLRDAARVFIAGWLHELRQGIANGAAAVTCTEIKADLQASDAVVIVHIATAAYRHDVTVALPATTPDEAEARALIQLDQKLAEAARVVEADAKALASGLAARLGGRGIPDWLLQATAALGLPQAA